MLIPIADRLQKVNMQIITLPVPAQDGITRDNVTVRVDAVIYFQVEDPVRAAVDVQDYMSAVGQVAQTSLRSIIGKSNLDDLLSNRERLNQGLELLIDSPALGWGIHIDRVEIKDVVLPDSMKRSIARQAEAERERRARVITADGELQASEKLAQAAEVMSEQPAALQLRLLQTVVEVAAEKNSTLVLPFPVELLRFLEKVDTRGCREHRRDARTDRTARRPMMPAAYPRGTARPPAFRPEHLVSAPLGHDRFMPMDAGAVNRLSQRVPRTFAACTRGDREIDRLLGHYGVPLIVTSDDGVTALMSDNDACRGHTEPDRRAARAWGITTPRCSNHRSHRFAIRRQPSIARACSRRDADGGGDRLPDHHLPCDRGPRRPTDRAAGRRSIEEGNRAQDSNCSGPAEPCQRVRTANTTA